MWLVGALVAINSIHGMCVVHAHWAFFFLLPENCANGDSLATRSLPDQMCGHQNCPTTYDDDGVMHMYG